MKFKINFKMKFKKIGGAKLPHRFALSTIALSILSVTLFEWRCLYNLDHPAPVKTACISCHADKRTLAAMADKAGDSLYLVHSGQMTLAELNALTGKQNDPGVSKPK